MNLVDYSFSRPTVAQLKMAKVDGVIRYLSEDSSKAISLTEASRLHDAGIPYALVYEDGAEDFVSAAAGLAKAQIAAKQLAALERVKLFGPDRPVYCAVDGNLIPARFAATWAAISAFAQALKRPAAVYGPRPFLLYAEAHGCRYLFESGAASWNTGPEPKNKTLQQLVAVPSGCGPLAGVDWDVTCARDWGQFPAPVVPVAPVKDARADVVEWAYWGVAHRGKAGGINYAEVRPFPLTDKLPITTDCSGFVTLCYYLAGCPDPNGLSYSAGAPGHPPSFTGSLLAHGKIIPLSEVLPGDVIVYGPGTGVHAAIVVEAGADPLTVSHGEEGDPSLVRVSQDGRQPQRYLRFSTALQFPEHVPAPSTEEDMILTHLHDGQPVVVFAAESGYRPLGPELQTWLLSAGYAFKPPLPQNPPLKNLGPFSAK